MGAVLMKRGILAAALFLTACGPQLAATETVCEGPVDTVYVNGRVWTAESSQPWAEALAVSGDKLVCVGGSDVIRRAVGNQTAVIDLQGRFVAPGFQDSHLHLPGPSLNSVPLEAVTNVAELQAKLKAFADANPDLPWITGTGWGYAIFPDATPDRSYLDAVIPDRPVYITMRDGHAGLGNSSALAALQITPATADPPNGQIVKDAAGRPTGEFREAAHGMVTGQIPPETADERYATLLVNMDDAASQGLTAVHIAGATPEAFSLFERALKADALKLRMHVAVPMIPGAGPYPKDHKLARPVSEADIAAYVAAREAFKGPLLTVASIKGMLDGAIDAQTAAMHAHYTGTETSGLSFWDPRELNETVALYDRLGFQVLLHAIGDKAIGEALDAFAYAATANGTSGRRHRVEHAEVPVLADLERFRELGVIASTQPIFANPDATVLNNFEPLLGPERAPHADSFSLFDDAGVRQAFGSDYPVFYLSPIEGIAVAVTRMTAEGKPPGGWHPAGRISVEAALRHYTIDGAFATFNEDIRGSLVAGKLADFVVLSQDLTQVQPTDIRETKVLMTIMGGRETYRDASF
jgi:predicted amidohydrolase YtcJ